MTAAEKQRRYRERQKDSGDLIRDFLTGVLSDAQKAVDAEDAPPWLLARSATAIEVLDAMGEVAEERPALLLNLIAVSYGALTDEEVAAALRQHDREFLVWLRTNAPVKGKVAKTGAVIAHNERILAWAQEERITGRSTAAILTQGLNAAKRLIRVRQSAGTAEQFALFSGTRRARAMPMLLDGTAIFR